MPIAAVAVAAVAIDAAVTTTTIFTVVAAVGATIGAIGVITGNKDLALAGTALGLVGGIGSLATDAGIIGQSGADATVGAESTTTSATAADAAAGNTTADTALAGTTDTAGAAAAATGDAAAAAADTGNPLDIVDSVTGNVTANPLDVPSGPMDVGTTAPTADQMLSNPNSVLSSSLDSTAPSTAAATNTASALPPQPAQISGTAPGQTVSTTPAAPASTAPSAPATPGVVSSLLSAAEKHPSLALGVMQAGGSLVSGLFNPVPPAQVNALNAQAAANNAATAVTQQQLSNMKSPLPTADKVQPTGLINTTSPTFNPATGTYG